MDKDRVRYTVPDYKGNPTSVPAWMLEAFMKAQDELRAKAERGESTEPDPKVLKQFLEDMEKDLEDF